MKKLLKIALMTLISLFIVLFILIPFLYFPFTSFELVKYEENSKFLFTGKTFQAYIDDARKRLERAKADPRFTEAIQKQLVDYNAPFELLPDKKFMEHGKYKKSIILFHGLWDSPFFFHDIAPYFQKKGFLVRAVLLPGMGTNPVDAMDTSYEEWLTMGRAIYKITQKDAEDIYLGGFSTGALVSQALVLEGLDIKGLFFFSPGAKIKNPLASFAGILKHITPFLSHAPIGFHRYGSLASEAVYQYVELYHLVLDELEKKRTLYIPLFTALSLDDTTIDQNDFLNNFMPHYVGKREIIVFKKPETQEKWDNNIIHINSYTNGIWGIGHTSLPISPKNEYLGANTERLPLLESFYPSFLDILLHNTKKQEQLEKILNGDYVMGSRTKKNIENSKKNLVNISYNPYFGKMMEEMENFIDKIGKK